MSQIESMLLQWRSLYAEWVVAELELRDARHRRPGSRGVALLEARVRHLQQECQAALDHASAALASGHEPEPDELHATPPPHESAGAQAGAARRRAGESMASVSP